MTLRSTRDGGDPRLHPAIIKANLALFRWEPSEARRYLLDYADEADSIPRDPLLLWLDAQTQDSPEDRMERLRVLTSVVSESDLYAQLAGNMLENEESYAALPKSKPASGKRFLGLSRAMLIGLSMALVLGVALIIFVVANPAANTATAAATADTSNVTVQLVAPTLLPIHSVPLPTDGYDVQFSAGRLQVTSVEDRSQRVIDQNGGVLAPIRGARFYAALVQFECAIGICDAPPEAALALRVDDQLNITPRTDAFVQDEATLQPIARGSSTSGWLIFEIPTDSVVDDLLIVPAGSAENTPPLLINLGATTR